MYVGAALPPLTKTYVRMLIGAALAYLKKSDMRC